MTVEDGYEIEAIVENLAVRRRKEEGARLHVHLSFAIRGNADLMAALALGLGNVFGITFEILQAPLMSVVLDNAAGEDGEEPEGFFSNLDEPEGAESTGNGLADKMIVDADADRRPVDPAEAAQAESNLRSRK